MNWRRKKEQERESHAREKERKGERQERARERKKGERFEGKFSFTYLFFLLFVCLVFQSIIWHIMHPNVMILVMLGVAISFVKAHMELQNVEANQFISNDFDDYSDFLFSDGKSIEDSSEVCEPSKSFESTTSIIVITFEIRVICRTWGAICYNMYMILTTK